MMRFNLPLRLRLFQFSMAILFISPIADQSVFGEDQKKTESKVTQIDLGIDSTEALKQYFELETSQIEKKFSLEKMNKTSWLKNKEIYRSQLAEMLGLSPLPKRTPLKATVTGEIIEDDFTVRKLHYQSSPGLYVTANLYLPKETKKPVPAVLYVCGHANRVIKGISYGNKTGYHHHGVWFARNGFVCLMIDTIGLGELRGEHHGTFSKNMHWWNARGYTPAGVEAWNGMRGIDYLQSLPQVDAERIGVTGRSGGGAYSWFIAAMDQRVKVAVPVAGITSMRNYVVDDCIERHCDCMFMVNSYGWDFPMVAALVAPRALLITNSDNDSIFPLKGVMDVYWQTNHIYEELGAADKIGVAITEGPHKDTQRLQVNAFEWFNRFLKNKKSDDLSPSEKVYEPEELKVFKELPTDQITTKIHDSFVAQAEPSVPSSLEQWKAQKQQWKVDLNNKIFHRWPQKFDSPESLHLKKLGTTTEDNLKTTVYSFTSQAPFVLPVYLVESTFQTAKKDSVTLYILGNEDWKDFESGELQKKIVAEQGTTCFVPTRGIGPIAWDGNAKKQNHIRRRFALLGQTLDSMRVWDVRQAVHAVRQIPECKNQEVHLQGRGIAASIALFTALFEPSISELTLQDLSASQASGAIFLNVLKVLDTPHALALAAEHRPVRLINAAENVDGFAKQVRKIPGSNLNEIQID